MLINLDTGILLRLLDRNDPHHANIRQALRVIMGRGDQAVSSPQNLAEFWNVCTRPASARGGFGLSIQQTDRRVRIIERLFRILPDSSTAYPLWRHMVVQHSIQGVQVHDARLVAWMQAYGIAHIVTLNTADFARYPGITALSPQDVLHP
jgi:predicted nucleic acid-binding protein